MKYDHLLCQPYVELFEVAQRMTFHAISIFILSKLSARSRFAGFSGKT